MDLKKIPPLLRSSTVSIIPPLLYIQLFTNPSLMQSNLNNQRAVKNTLKRRDGQVMWNTREKRKELIG
jgi:hypothetical protein